MNVCFLDHPADLRMRVWGNTQEELFLEAALGMMSKVAVLSSPPGAPAENRHLLRKQSGKWAGTPPKSVTIRIVLEAPSTEDLFVAWLNEILYLFSAKDFFFTGARFDRLEEGRLSATLEGFPVQKGLLEKGVEIKGATYHDLHIKKKPRWEAEVILDV